MANQNNNGRHVAGSDENRPSWRPQDQQDHRAQGDDDRGNARHWDEQRDRGMDRSADRSGDRSADRSIDRGGQGQSGYAAGWRDDRGMGTMGRNQDMGRSDDRDFNRGVNTDDRFYGRGGQNQRGDAPRGYGDEAGDRPGFVQHTGYQGGSAYGRMEPGYDRQPSMDRSYGQTSYGQSSYGQGPSSYGQSGTGHNQYGNYGNSMSQHGGYAPNQGGYAGNYGQRGQQDSYGQGDFGMRGTGARGGGHRGKGPQNFTRSDERLKEHVSEMLTEHDEIDASSLHVEVKNGEVTLTGTVEDRHQRRMIEDLIEGMSGVKDVHMSIKLHGDRDRMGPGAGHKPATSSTTPSLESNGASTNDSRKARA